MTAPATTAQQGWIKRAWARLPEEEQKLLAGLILAALGAGALRITGHGVALDVPVLGIALYRYLTDSIQRALT